MNKVMNPEERQFVTYFSDNLNSIKREINDLGGEGTNRFIALKCFLSESTVEKYCKGYSTPSSIGVNNLITGLNREYDEVITLFDNEPVDWSYGYSLTNQITSDEYRRIADLRQTIPFLMQNKNFPNDRVSDRSIYIYDNYCISERDYKKCLSEGLVDLLTECDDFGTRRYLDDVDILAKAMLVPARTLYSYLEGTRMINPLYAYNIITFLGIMPEALLGNFDTFVLSSQTY